MPFVTKTTMITNVSWMTLSVNTALAVTVVGIMQMVMMTTTVMMIDVLILLRIATDLYIR